MSYNIKLIEELASIAKAKLDSEIWILISLKDITSTIPYDDLSITFDSIPVPKPNEYKQLALVNKQTDFYRGFKIEMNKWLTDYKDSLSEHGIPEKIEFIIGGKTLEQLLEYKQHVTVKTDTRATTWAHSILLADEGMVAKFKDKRLAIEIAYVFAKYKNWSKVYKEPGYGQDVVLTEGVKDHDFIIAVQPDEFNDAGSYIWKYGDVLVHQVYNATLSDAKEIYARTGKIIKGLYKDKAQARKDMYDLGYSPEDGEDMDEEEMTKMLEDSKRLSK